MEDNELFCPYENVDAAIAYYSEKIKNDFDFFKHVQTGYHEIDMKRYEARLCIIFDLSITAIIMVGVLIEETLKTLLKIKYAANNRDKTLKTNLDEMSRISKESEDTYGSFTLHSAIEKAYKENIINEGEKGKLMLIKKDVRNAYIHSDKAKIFDKDDKREVFQARIKDNNINLEDQKMMSILELLPVQGIAQKKMADEIARPLFLEVDGMILEITKRFKDLLKYEHN